MNTIQKRILAIFVPILVFAVVYGIAGTALDKKCPSEEKIGALTLCDRYKLINAQKIPEGYDAQEVNAFDFEKTYIIWGLGVLAIFIFEFKLFEDKKKKS
ncbi:hypothetical protein M0P48_02375 [Candidatus Gracilibacteria bacterium]|nr:hypothetical protein [Candidatus Gracilibacteria bacterium]